MKEAAYDFYYVSLSTSHSLNQSLDYLPFYYIFITAAILLKSPFEKGFPWMPLRYQHLPLDISSREVMFSASK